MQKIRATITAIGKYTPKRILNNYDLEKMVDTSDEWIRTRTGIFERHIAAKGEASSDMASAAFEDMRSRFNIDPEEIDLIIVATITPDMFFPSTAALIQHNIGATNAFGFDISAACSGFVYALAIAVEFIENGRYKKVLVVGSDTMSTITDYTNRDTCILFGDAASVALLEPTEENYGILDYILKLDGKGKDCLYMAGGGSKNPATHETIDKKMHYIYQEGKTVFKFAVSKMAEISVDLLKRNSFKSEDVGMFIPHQANKRIIDACVSRLKLKDKQVMINIDKYANTTAATIPLGIVDAYDQGRLKKGDLLLMSAFGGGFTWGSVLMRWSL
ncbi:MAG: ketoacyl-ACP synthase III [Candidatus Marinimicrobia bacterium]|nr:ketoacyl-ACP synthase III [Candidatus Neomarinimicrobiota bacterium]